MRIDRHYTEANANPYDAIPFATAKSEIRNPDGSVVFSLDDIEVPAAWSQVAADVLAQKYFRKAGVPARLKRVEENGVPSFLWRSVARRGGAAPLPKDERDGSARPRRGRCSTGSPAPGPIGAGRAAISTAEEDAQAFYDEIALHAGAARWPRPTRRNGSTPACIGPMASTARARAISTSTTQTGKLTKSKSAYEHPQPHACFIQSVADDLVNDGGIMDLWVREARLFKYGSGTGSNFSKLRGENEKLSGGGSSSGLMSFLKIGDRAAGAIKSGGTTRRAAKMVVVDVDHPDIEAFIDWKVKEEEKVAALVAGSKIVKKHLKAILRACVNCEGSGDDCFNAGKEPGAEARDQARAPRRGAGRHASSASSSSRARAIKRHRVRHLRHRLGQRGLSDRLRPELQQHRARHRRLPARGGGRRRLDADRAASTASRAKTIKARELWDKIGYAAWASADPGVQFHTTINDWHTCPARGPISASQPVLGIYVPRRHRLQSRLAQPVAVPRSARPSASTSTPMSTRCGCGPWCSKSRC